MLHTNSCIWYELHLLQLANVFTNTNFLFLHGNFNEIEECYTINNVSNRKAPTFFPSRGLNTPLDWWHLYIQLRPTLAPRRPAAHYNICMRNLFPLQVREFNSLQDQRNTGAPCSMTHPTLINHQPFMRDLIGAVNVGYSERCLK